MAVMRRLLPVLALALAAHASAQTPAAVVLPRLSADECAVWRRESSFAASVAAHDASAFAEHLHPGAVFGAKGPQPSRGSEAVAKRWAGLIEGKTLKLSWYPAMVAIGGEADTAYSSGPALYEDLVPGAKPRFLLGAFQSVWHRGDDGVWRVLFDDGIEPRAASEAEVVAFHAGRRSTLPARLNPSLNGSATVAAGAAQQAYGCPEPLPRNARVMP